MKLRRLAYGFSTLVLSLSSLVVLVSPVAHAAGNTCTWTGATDLVFETATNWSCSGGGAGSAPTDGDVLDFPVNVLTGTSGATINIVGDRSFAGVTVSGTYGTGVYGDFNLTGSGTITLTGPINITASGGAGVTFTTNVTLGADVAVDSPASTNGHATFAGMKTLALSTHNLSVTGSATISALSNVTGSGNIAVAGYASFLGDNSGYNGTISTTAAKSTVYFSTLASLKGSIDMIASSAVFIGGIDYGTNTTVTTPITVRGDGFDDSGPGGTYHVPALSVSFSGAMADAASVVDFSGVSLSADSTISIIARNNDTIKFSGTGLAGHTFIASDGSQGKLIVGGQTVKASPYVSTYADSQPTIDLQVFDNNVTIMNGTYKNMTVYAGGILKGTGTIAVLTVSGGTVAPGQSPGILNTGNVTYTSGTLDVEVGGAASGQYDQLNVTGTVDLGSATTLNVTQWSNFVPATGDTFTIIKNDGADAVTGTFQGLAEGATVTSTNGVSYTISYKGGDGNDVVLTALATTTATTPDTGFEHFTSNPLATLIGTFAIVAVVSLIARRQLKNNK
ncbi:MAG: hypothetical protein U0491_01365 [Candidatus Saccharimonadales bacterium]